MALEFWNLGLGILGLGLVFWSSGIQKGPREADQLSRLSLFPHCRAQDFRRSAMKGSSFCASGIVCTLGFEDWGPGAPRVRGFEGAVKGFEDPAGGSKGSRIRVRPTRGPEPGPNKADRADWLSRPSGRAKNRTLSTGWTAPGRKGADWADRLSRPRVARGFEDFGDDQRVRGLGPRGG